MSIQARMKLYKVLAYMKSQNPDTGRMITSWQPTGETIAGTFYQGRSAEQTQSVFYRDLNSFLITLQRPDLKTDKHRILIDGEEYDVGDIYPIGSRYIKIELRSEKERKR